MDRLHPRVQALLAGWSGLTGAQQAAIDPLLAGRSILLVAPTGHGKTEAAMLPVLSRLVAEKERLREWPPGFKVLYVTPLRALNRDLFGRLEEWTTSLGLTIGVRHGDTSQAERARQSRKPPDILITTPETVQLLLYGDTLRRHLGMVRFVVLDEVHELAMSERGAQLMVALERIEEVIAQDALRHVKAPQRTCPAHAQGGGRIQRIGLSATVADPTAVAAFLGGVDVVETKADKRIELEVVHPEATTEDTHLAARLGIPPEAAAQLRAVRRIVKEHDRVIVFQNTRDGAELMVSRGHLLEEGLLELHHGSLSPEHRADVETRFKQGRIKAIVATSSLELGIDVGAIDHVVQVGSPRSVARLVQRLGRAGHRVGLVSKGTLVASGPEDVLECTAVAKRAMEGRLEPLAIREAPLVVLANQLIALVNEYADLRRLWAYEVITRAGPFRDLDQDLYDVVWQTLQEVKTLFGDRDRLQRGGRARRHFLDHISLIPDEKKYRVLDESTKRGIGTVDDAFVVGLHPGALFIMAGRSWQVLEIEADGQRLRVGPVNDLGAVPQWSGQQLPVSREVAQETAALRQEVADGRMIPGAADVIRRQVEAGLQVPTDTRLCLETAGRQVVFHVPLGTRGNETLGRITAALLHQRLGTPVGMESDAYRIHFRLPESLSVDAFEELWRSLDPDSLEILLAVVLRDAPAVRQHLVHVAKHFGALPKELDPNRTTRARLDTLLSNLALHEETISRLVHERLDLAAVEDFLGRLQRGDSQIVKQAIGPIARLGREAAANLLLPRSDDTLLQEVRTRIEDSDVLLVCCNCGHDWGTEVRHVPRQVHCRRCQSRQVACMRPWHKDQARLVTRDPAGLDAEERNLRTRILQNGATMSSFGPVAARLLVARGIGPDAAARILQKVSDPEDPAFWREVLRAEIEFARTHMFWR